MCRKSCLRLLPKVLLLSIPHVEFDHSFSFFVAFRSLSDTSVTFFVTFFARLLVRQGDLIALHPSWKPCHTASCPEDMAYEGVCPTPMSQLQCRLCHAVVGHFAILVRTVCGYRPRKDYPINSTNIWVGNKSVMIIEY